MCRLRRRRHQDSNLGESPHAGLGRAPSTTRAGDTECRPRARCARPIGTGGFEPPRSTRSGWRSTTELRARVLDRNAADGIRTREDAPVAGLEPAPFGHSGTAAMGADGVEPPYRTLVARRMPLPHTPAPRGRFERPRPRGHHLSRVVPHQARDTSARRDQDSNLGSLSGHSLAGSYRTVLGYRGRRDGQDSNPRSPGLRPGEVIPAFAPTSR